MSEKQYIENQFAKLLTVLNAAEQNKGFYTDVRITTTGTDPSAAVTIPAHVIRKFLKAP